MTETSPTRLALIGYGKMGRLVESLAPEYGFEVALKLDEFNNENGAGLTAENFAGVEASIDFSIPSAVAGNAVRLAELGVDQTIGTTGWLDEIERVREAVERAKIGLVYGANFSVGVQAFYRIVAAAAEVFAAEPDYDCWAYEAHHKMKKDAPSGTMLRLLEVIKQAGCERPVDVAVNRVGWMPGTHEVGFDSEADTIRISHTARSRTGFARGALRAARWIVGRKGIHEFSAVWDQMA